MSALAGLRNAEIEAPETWDRVLAKRKHPEPRPILVDERTDQLDAWRFVLAVRQQRADAESRRLVAQGMAVLRTIFPRSTTYTLRQLKDHDSGDVTYDCEIGVQLSVDDAHTLFERFESWWLEHGDLNTTFTLKFG